MDIAEAADKRTEEYLTHSPSNRFAAIAPHGRYIEKHTETQPFILADILNSCSAWAFCGYVENGSAKSEFHTTSIAIDPADHQMLGELTMSEFSLAVAFHGYEERDDRPDIYVGGRLNHEDRGVVASRIRERTRYTVETATRDDDSQVKGMRRSNIVNEVADNAGLQLEQTMEVREDHRREVCSAVAEALEDVADGV